MDWKEILGVVGALVFIGLLLFLFVAPAPSMWLGTWIGASELEITSFGQALWEFRSLDVFLQIFLILTGVLGFLTLIKHE